MMKGDALLPGVGPKQGPRTSPSYDGRDAVQRARLREDLRDLADLAILGVVDFMFLGWDAAHVPGLSRVQTLNLLLVVTIAIALFLLMRRLIPMLHARRIASTWSEDERRQSSRPAGVTGK